jgi:hypothetical protein
MIKADARIYIFLLLLLSALVPVHGALLKITSPKSGDIYQAGATLTISYLYVDVDTIKIEVFSPKNGGIWEVIVDSLKTSPQPISIPLNNPPDWAHYKIRMSDVKGVAPVDTTQEFTILNSNARQLSLTVFPDTVRQHEVFNVHWDISPSVDTIIFQGLGPLDADWVTLPLSFNTADSVLPFNLSASLPGGKYYLRMLDADSTKFSSNIDSVFLRDTAFAGLHFTYPTNNQIDVLLRLEGSPVNLACIAAFNEPVQLTPGKKAALRTKGGILVQEISVSDTAYCRVIADSNGHKTLVGFYFDLPLIHSTEYYVTVEPSAVTDNFGNVFNGFTKPTDWAFKTVVYPTFSGRVSYDGSTFGPLMLGLFTRADVEKGKFDSPVTSIGEQFPSFPYNYSVGVPSNGDFAIYCFMDYDNNGEVSGDEPVAFSGNLTMQGDDSTNIHLHLEEAVFHDSVFLLDVGKSYWGAFKPLQYNGFAKAFYAGTWASGRTPGTDHPHRLDDNLWGVGFWIHETDSDDLANSLWNAGTLLHLEYTYPDSLEINFVASGGNIKKVQILKNRLIVDVEVINPVESASGDLGASCGLIISCSPAHTGGVNAHGSVFYGNIYSADMGVAVYPSTNTVGMRIHGKNGVEVTFTALLSDSFLINNYPEVTPQNLPANSLTMRGFIPGLDASDYIVDKSAPVITTGFDIDGDGKANKMYKVVIKNSNWSPHDLLFGKESNAVGVNEIQNKISIWYSQSNGTLHITEPLTDVTIYDMKGSVVARIDEMNPGSHSVMLQTGVYIVFYNSNNKTGSIKVAVW